MVVGQPGALAIDRRVLLGFPGQRLDDEFVGEFALGHDLGRGGRGGHALFLLTMRAALFPQGHADVEGGRIAHQFLAALVADDRALGPALAATAVLGMAGDDPPAPLSLVRMTCARRPFSPCKLSKAWRASAGSEPSEII